MYSHPGKKSLFMGGEFGQFVEWRFAEQLDWVLDKYEMHHKLSAFSAELNKFYKSNGALYEIEREQGEWRGFKWLCADDRDNSVLSFMRVNNKGDEKLAVILNFTPVERAKYIIGVPEYGEYETVFSTNAKAFGGDGKGTRRCKTKAKPYNGFPYSIEVQLPPLTALYLKLTPLEPPKKTAPKKGRK